MFIDGHCRATDHTYNTSRNNAASVSVCIAISASLVCSVRPFNQSTTVAMQCVCTVAPAGRPTERSRPVAVAAARLSWRSGGVRPIHKVVAARRIVSALLARYYCIGRQVYITSRLTKFTRTSMSAGHDFRHDRVDNSSSC